MTKEKKNLSFLEHLEILRWHLVRSSLAIAIGAILAFLFKGILFDLVIFGPIDPHFVTYQWFCNTTRALGAAEIFCLDQMPFQILNTKMAGQFSVHIWVSLAAGFILAFPYILWELWRFVSPGLHDSERNYSRLVLVFAGILFALGVLFGYYLIVPLSVQFLGGYSVSASVNNLIDLVSYITTVSSVTLATGLIFELPVVVYFLARTGLLTPDWMKQYRRHAIVLILLLSAVITPPDVASQVLVSLPIVLLYEISIIICRRVVRRMDQQARRT